MNEYIIKQHNFRQVKYKERNISDENRLLKNNKMRISFLETKEKRKEQSCRVFKVKIDTKQLNSLQQEQLKMQFVEAKWLVNDMINFGLQDGNKIWEYKLSDKIIKKDKDFNNIEVELKYLGSQTKQELVKAVISNIKTLATRKKKGFKIGRLKFRKEVNSLNLKQFGVSYNIKSRNYIKVQGVKGNLKCHGLQQIMTKKGNFKYDIANAKLLKTAQGYYLAISCYQDKNQVVKKEKIKENIGIDFGCSTAITLSNGKKFESRIQESDRLKKLQKKLSRQVKGSANRMKTIKLIGVEYQKISNRKNDLANKVVNEIKNYQGIFMQDENLSGWSKSGNGKVVQGSILGRVKAQLINCEGVTVLDRFEPTTQLCPCCLKKNKLKLSQRTYKCDCGYQEDRDVHAAKNMIFIALNKEKINNKVGQELPDVKPVKIKLDFVERKLDEAFVNEAGKVQLEETRVEAT